MRRTWILFLLILASLAGCKPSPQIEESAVSESAIAVNVSIRSIDFPKAFFKPGEPVRWSVRLHSESPVRIELDTTIRYLAEPIAIMSQPVEFGPGELILQLSWLPTAKDPLEAIAPRGYGLDVILKSNSGEVMASRSSGFDVLELWNQHPRYGFMTGFEPGRTDGEAALNRLLDFHINGLQFYDWMYRHDQYLTEEDPYVDPLGRQLSLVTVQSLIDAAHARGMAAMPYTAVYAASVPFYKQHSSWALLQKDGTPHLFGDNFLVIMDPRPGSPWTEHLLGEFNQILEQTAFDGIHLDQYGAPKIGYDASGKGFRLDEPLAALINATKTVATAQRGEDGTVIFNAVTNWPILTVAPSDQDMVYIEVWPPFTTFNALGQLIVQAQELSGGKPVVIAAYIDPSYEVNARLIDAILFANGAGHIELGEQGGYLSDPYFPKFSLPSPELAEDLRRYYEFALRYQNLIGPQARSAQAENLDRLVIEGVETSANLTKDRVMPVFRESEDYLAISLVNLLELDSGEWALGATTEPRILEEVRVELPGLERQVGRLWFATPDREDYALTSLEFTQEDGSLHFRLPGLRYWDLVVIEWSGEA